MAQVAEHNLSRFELVVALSSPISAPRYNVKHPLAGDCRRGSMDSRREGFAEASAARSPCWQACCAPCCTAGCPPVDSSSFQTGADAAARWHSTEEAHCRDRAALTELARSFQRSRKQRGIGHSERGRMCQLPHGHPKPVRVLELSREARRRGLFRDNVLRRVWCHAAAG